MLPPPVELRQGQGAFGVANGERWPGNAVRQCRFGTPVREYDPDLIPGAL